MTQFLELDGVKYEKLFDEPILGVPFKGVNYLNGADLEGDRFSPDYDRGPLPFVLTYLAHAKSVELGVELVGVSQYLNRDDYGDWFDVWVRQDSQYKDGLRELKRRGMVRASSYPFQRTVQMSKSADGTNVIERWHVTELTLTGSSMSPAATFKSQLPEDLEKSVLTLEDILQMAKEKDVTETTEVAPETTPEATPDLAADAIAALNGAGESDTETTEESVSVVDAIMKALQPEFTALIKRMEDHEKAVDAKVNGLGTSFSKAMTDFGEATRKALTGEFGKSAPQRRAEDVIKNRPESKQPPASDKPRVAPNGPSV